MEVVTHTELAQALDQMCTSFKEGVAKLVGDMGAPPYLTRDEAAEYFRVSRSTFERIEAKGDILDATVGGRRTVYRRQNLGGYVEKQLRKAAR